MQTPIYVKTVYSFLSSTIKACTSFIEFSNKLDKLFISYSKVTFVIGGSLGLGQELINRANYRLKLSDMTFLHQMTRLIVLEQIYRCFKILNNETYHK